MNLKNYIMEYVSSGRKAKLELVYPGCTLGDILDWFRYLDIPGYMWGTMHALPVCKNGELKYLTGPWSSDPSEQWAIVVNHFSQYIMLCPNLKVSIFFKKDGSAVETNFYGAVNIIKKMVEDPNRKIEDRDIRELNESISSGRGGIRSIYSKLDIDSTVEDITSFLESFGFTKMKRMTIGTPKEPQYSVEPSSLNEGFSICFKFEGRDKRLYWGQFKTGNFPVYSRLLDITVDRHPTPVFVNVNPKYSKETIDQIIDFLLDQI
jgi:hypothetical protein